MRNADNNLNKDPITFIKIKRVKINVWHVKRIYYLKKKKMIVEDKLDVRSAEQFKGKSLKHGNKLRI